MAKKRMLFVGNAAIRFAVGTPYIPAPGESIISDGNYTFAPGGRSALSAIAAARLGYDVALCARVGDDYYGDRLVEVFRNEGLHIANVTVKRECQTGLSLELTEPDGTTREIFFPGANAHLDHAYAEGAMSCRPDAVVASLEGDKDMILRLSALAEERGIPFFLDGSVRQEAIPTDFPFEQLGTTELLILNDADARVFSGIDPNNEENRKMACYTIRKRFDVRYVLLQLGNTGSFIYDGKYFSAISGPESEVADPAGASEAYTAALIGDYLQGGDLRASAEFASAVYAAVASRHGGYQSLPQKKA